MATPVGGHASAMKRWLGKAYDELEEEARWILPEAIVVIALLVAAAAAAGVVLLLR